jgi:tripartite-type tricarboxylate transporter receptor subunit TctC
MRNTSDQGGVTRRSLLRAGAAATLLPAVARAQGDPAAQWPNRLVRVIVPYPAGGSTDVLARIVADKLKDKFGQTFVIENRPGAGGNIGIDALAKSDPDGYTIATATVGNFTINQYLYAKIPYDAERDLMPVSMSWEFPNIAVVSAQHVPAKTLQEFIAWAKTREHGVSFASPGIGTTPHLSGALFCARHGIKGTHVPFRGASFAIPAMLSGDVTFAIDNLASYVSMVGSGQMRGLAVTSSERWPTMPDVPTMAEAGVDSFVVTSWAAIVVPKATPRGIVDKLSAALREMANDATLKERFLQAGGRSLGSTPEDVLALIEKQKPMWQEMVKISGAKVD